MKLSIIIPVFNESKTIEKVLSEIKKKVKTTHEIIIVYDYEKDPTNTAVKKYIKSHKARNIRLEINSEGSGKGVANAVKTGFKKAKCKALIVILGDCCDDISLVDIMFKLVEEGNDIVCGSRYMHGGKKIGGPLIKSLLSKIAGLTSYYLFKLPTHDPTNSFKMFNKDIFKKIQIESNKGFEYSMEIVAKANKLGYKITEIPTTWTERTEGKSKFKVIKWLPYYFKWYIYQV